MCSIVRVYILILNIDQINLNRLTIIINRDVGDNFEGRVYTFFFTIDQINLNHLIVTINRDKGDNFESSNRECG